MLVCISLDNSNCNIFFCPFVANSTNRTFFQGAFCPGDSNKNFTLCPLGTYQPNRGRSACLRCPVGFHCPDEGMPVPRVCPAGKVCDVTGIARADQPCPEGHFCLEGTATTATTCGHPRCVQSWMCFPSLLATMAEAKKKDCCTSFHSQSECWDACGKRVTARSWTACGKISPLHLEAPFLSNNDVELIANENCSGLAVRFRRQPKQGAPFMSFESHVEPCTSTRYCRCHQTISSTPPFRVKAEHRFWPCSFNERKRAPTQSA